ncbi:nucleotide exchange factor GrpE [Paenibacillus endoradicis]|uniref:nucleotide exchange factor GrpE n=1 Tax=Paenibacillus endoradicis TaxID=2972487 RepID=UPI0021593039|nr:nucleotide exchange factor GrpE [Paenibacillus endoradicis]MCR8659201.1 nucleotide exchange factor GrpE [Paenibacillus endoradicis]
MSTKKQNNEFVDTATEQVDSDMNHDEVNETTQQAAQEPQVNEVTEENSQTVELLAQLDEAQQKLLRVQADFDNFRRRTQKEKEELAKYASAKLVENLLPTVDNFDRAIAASAANQDYDALAKGVDMIFRLLMSTVEAEGLITMDTIGQPFNPEYHQAVMTVETDEYEEGIIVEELQKGYLIKDKVIRPAMVKVSG